MDDAGLTWGDLDSVVTVSNDFYDGRTISSMPVMHACGSHGKNVSTVEGVTISSSRILIAAVLGPFIVGDPALLLQGWLGAAIIMGVNILIAVRKARNS